MASTREKSVLEVILDWSLGRPQWQRDALRRIVVHGGISGQDIEDLLKLIMSENGEDVEGATPVPLAVEHIPTAPDSAKPVSLASISSVVGVNQLAPDQTLSFEQNGITVVYGQNGSGKSGYSRILKNACRSRHRQPIEGNVFSSENPFDLLP